MYVPTGHSLSMPMLNWVLITYTPLEEKFQIQYAAGLLTSQ